MLTFINHQKERLAGLNCITEEEVSMENCRVKIGFEVNLYMVHYGTDTERTTDGKNHGC